MKKLTIALLLAMAQQVFAQGMKTAGDGTTYTLDLLSQIEGMQIDKYVDEDDGEVIYSIYATDTIAAGDKFVMDDDVTLLFDDDVALVIEGEADFQLTKGSTFDSAFDDADYVSPVGIIIANEKSQTVMTNCQFYYVGLRCASTKGIKLSDCAFYNNNTAIGAAALYFTTTSTDNVITNCTFGYNKKAAIGSPANANPSMEISHCTFTANSQLNSNVPQLNLTAATTIVIDNCTIEGDPTLNMVGGIGISNFFSYEDTHLTVSNCSVADNRYGLGTVGAVSMVSIEGNTFTGNCHETNPMNGGSGISLYDPYQKTTAMIKGNHIEGSLWGITVIGCKDVNIGRVDVDVNDPNYNPGGNVFKDNGNGGELYDLYNNSANTVYAQGNTWNVNEQTQEKIETVIFHNNDNPQLGEVIYMPAAATNSIATTEAHNPQATATYNLQGIRLSAPTRKGIYIRRIKELKN